MTSFDYVTAQEALGDLLADPVLRARMGSAARARAVADYSWNARMAPLVALCERLAGPSVEGVTMPATWRRGRAETRRAQG